MQPALTAPPRDLVLDRARSAPLLEADLRDLSPTVIETCSALALSLREGDLAAAERLFGFVVDQVPDRRLALETVLRPLIGSELQQELTPTARRLLIRTSADLMLRLRRLPASHDTPGALLYAPGDGLEALTLLMVSLLLDDADVPSYALIGHEPEALHRRAASQRESVICIAPPTPTWLAAAGPMLRSLRSRTTSVVLFGDWLGDQPDLVRQLGATASAGSIGEACDLLLHLRGPLTCAEAEALRMAADGYTNTRIAHEIGITLSAVKARLEGGYAKLGAADRTHAVAIALRRRWIR